MILADTNVVSEFMRDTPDHAVLAWAQRIDPSGLTICVVTVEEIERGLGRLPRGRRRRNLEQRWSGLMVDFADAIAVYDLPAARETARSWSRPRRPAGRCPWPTPRSRASAFPAATSWRPAMSMTSRTSPA